MSDQEIKMYVVQVADSRETFIFQDERHGLDFLVGVGLEKPSVKRVEECTAPTGTVSVLAVMSDGTEHLVGDVIPSTVY